MEISKTLSLKHGKVYFKRKYKSVNKDQHLDFIYQNYYS